ncbi:anaerobic ribonucleoside-triphosphate reductase activating protein [Blastococcus mobilis]|uniref:Anaerobic ribonucleoside-triphosphate reductase activating protein n=1 Tax=Blastococcus mobilis TaxID=1938746 RepID=A0A239ATD2_9ACTN|nr:anaerobic ribonucleoside-triphosphate reductase activating protein [Blastococcus mobilis]
MGGLSTSEGRTTAPPDQADDAVLSMARFVPATYAEGPGLRAALWVQGCSIRCPGCFNPQLWARRGGSDRQVTDLVRELLESAATHGVEGITLLGGEPFEQAAPLARVARGLRQAGLSVMTFTGYEWADLRRWAESRPDIGALLEATDLLADGPFLADSIDTSRPWIGSRNQGLRALTDRYAEQLATFDRHPDRVEVRVAADGEIAVNGWANADALDALFADLGRRNNRH